MLKEKITYVDFNGQEVTEAFYFNLTKAETIELEASIEGGLSSWIQDISVPKNPGMVIDTFKKMLAKSYGEKTPDGKHFFKNELISSSFFASAAYSQLFEKLISDAEYAQYFVNNLLHDPKKATQPTEVQQQFSQTNAPAPQTVQVPTPPSQPAEPAQETGSFGQPVRTPEEEATARREEALRVARARAEAEVLAAEQNGTLGQQEIGGHQ